MRVATLMRRLIDVTGLIVEDVLFTMYDDVSVAVRPRWKAPRCGGCGGRAPGYDRQPLRHWKHLCFGRMRVALTYAPRRVRCSRCGVRVERVPWADGSSRFTLAFEELVAYLAQITDKTKVTELTGIAWASVGSIVDRLVSRRLDPGRLEGLRFLGVDEFSYRKRHRYLTVVVDHERRRVVWAGEGRSAEVLGQFFAQLGDQGRAAIEAVTIDMAGGYRKAVQEWLPHAQIVYDRFHVQRLAADAVDEVRRTMVRELEGTAEARAVKKTRYALLKNPWHLSESENAKLAQIQHTNQCLYRAYLLKESLPRPSTTDSPGEPARLCEPGSPGHLAQSSNPSSRSPEPSDDTSTGSSPTSKHDSPMGSSKDSTTNSGWSPGAPTDSTRQRRSLACSSSSAEASS